MKNSIKVLIILTKNQKTKIKEIADFEGLTFSDKVRRILDEYLDFYFSESNQDKN